MIIEGKDKSHVIDVITEVIYQKYMRVYFVEFSNRPEVQVVLESLKKAAIDAATEFVNNNKLKLTQDEGVLVKWGKTTKEVWPSCKKIAVEKYCNVMDSCGYNLQLSTNRQRIRILKR